MKKVLVCCGLALAFMASEAKADSVGCGLGAIVWKGQSGIVPQTLAVTTNGTFYSQTFGITTGTSGCRQNDTISGGTGKLVFSFLENNLEQFAVDASRGHGETIDTIASIVGTSSEKVGLIARANFGELFANSETDAASVATKMVNLLG